MKEIKKDRDQSPGYKILFLTPNISDPTSYVLWSGVVEKAQELNLDLITVTGGKINDQSDYNYQSNILYDMIAGQTDFVFHGVIIWASAIGTFIDEQSIKDFTDKFNKVPVITLGKKISGYPCIIVDNYFSMKEEVAHLIRDHGRKRIGFIRGPHNYFYAEERLRAYKDALNENGINIDHNLISPPDVFNSATGVNAIKYFLDESQLIPGSGIDAIAGVSDEVAISAMNELLRRNIPVPESVSVAGFNNNLQCKTVNPQITSVDIYFNNFGKIAVENINILIRGGSIDQEIIAPSCIIFRESCGCINKILKDIDAPHKNGSGQLDLRGELISKKEHAAAEIKSSLLKFIDPAKAGELSALIYDNLCSDLADKGKSFFYRFFNDLISGGSYAKFDYTAWEIFINDLYRLLYSLIDIKSDDIEYVEFLIHQLRISVMMMLDYYLTNKKGVQRVNIGNLLDASLRIVSNVQMEDLFNHLKSDLMKLGIPSCGIFIYEGGNAVKLFGYNGDDVNDISSDNAGFKDYMRDVSDNKECSSSFVILSLYFKIKNIGYVVFKQGPSDGLIYTLLRGQISSSLQEIFTLLDLKESQNKRAELLADLRKKNKDLEKTMSALVNEMEIAKKIQTSLLPPAINIPGYEYAAYLGQIDEIGGDYFDVIEGESGDCWINISDVSKHGIVSGLIMMMFHSANHAGILLKPDIMPDELIIYSNRVLFSNLKNRLEQDNVITACLFKFNKNGDFFHSGFHKSILIYRHETGKVDEIKTTGMWLGVAEDLSGLVSLNRFKMNKNDVMLLYTDGAVEVMNGLNELFGIHRLIEVFNKNADDRPKVILDSVINAINGFKSVQKDDITLLILKKTE